MYIWTSNRSLYSARLRAGVNYSGLVNAVQFIGYDYFKHLHRGDNANKSQHIISLVLAAETEKNNWKS